MGKLIDKYKSEDPNFAFELNELKQRFKSENQIEAVSSKNDEINQFKNSIKELRSQLEKLKIEKQEAVQKAISTASLEIQELKSLISSLRDELDNLQFAKKEAVQKAIQGSVGEIAQLKESTQNLRIELEKVIKNYEKKLIK